MTLNLNTLQQAFTGMGMDVSVPVAPVLNSNSVPATVPVDATGVDYLLAYLKKAELADVGEPLFDALLTREFKFTDVALFSSLANFGRGLDGQKATRNWRDLTDLSVDELKLKLNPKGSERVNVYREFACSWLSTLNNVTRVPEYLDNCPVLKISLQERFLYVHPPWLDKHQTDFEGFLEAYSSLMGVTYVATSVGQVAPVIAASYMCSGSMNLKVLDRGELLVELAFPQNLGMPHFTMVSEQPPVKALHDVVKSTIIKMRGKRIPFFAYNRVDPLLIFVNVLEAVDPKFQGLAKESTRVEKLEPLKFSKNEPKTTQDLFLYYGKCMNQLTMSREFRTFRKRGDDTTKGWGSVFPLLYDQPYIACMALAPALEHVLKAECVATHVLGDPEIVALAFVGMGRSGNDATINAYGNFASGRTGVTIRHDLPENLPSKSLLVSFLNYTNSQSVDDGVEGEEAAIVSSLTNLKPKAAIFSFHMPNDLGAWLQRAETNPATSAWYHLSRSYCVKVFKGNRAHNGYVYLACTPLERISPLENLWNFVVDMTTIASEGYMINICRDHDITFGKVYPTRLITDAPGIDFLKQIQPVIPYSVPRKQRAVENTIARSTFAVPSMLKDVTLSVQGKDGLKDLVAKPPEKVVVEEMIDVETTEEVVLNSRSKRKTQPTPPATPSDSESDSAETRKKAAGRPKRTKQNGAETFKKPDPKAKAGRGGRRSSAKEVT